MGNKVYVDNGTELCKMVHFVCGSHLNKKRTLEKETHKRREGWLHTGLGLTGSRNQGHRQGHLASTRMCLSRYQRNLL